MVEVDISTQHGERPRRNLALNTGDPRGVERRQLGFGEADRAKAERQTPVGLSQNRPTGRPDQFGEEALEPAFAHAGERRDRPVRFEEIDRPMHHPSVQFIKIDDVGRTGTWRIVASTGAMFDQPFAGEPGQGFPHGSGGQGQLSRQRGGHERLTPTEPARPREGRQRDQGVVIGIA